MLRGLVFNLQKYSLHDGPGLRTTVFLKGCPLCCAWCHNPEGVSPRPELLLVENRCVACGQCRQACPLGAALPAGQPVPPGHESCQLCGACVEACPTGARQIVGRDMTVAELMREILRDQPFYEESRGGVTFSGGEPLLQAAFLCALLEACQARGLHTAVDTCGFGCTEHLLAVGERADLVLYDLKLMDDARHRRHTGVPNTPILENLQRLDQTQAEIWVRVPLIPGVNDDDENLSAMARFVAGLRRVQQVNVLPYHRTGTQKWRRLGRRNPLEALQAPSPESLERALGWFREAGLKAVLGG